LPVTPTAQRVALAVIQAPPDVATIGGKHCRGCETALYGSKPFADGIERLLDNVPQWVRPSTLSPQIILWLPSVLYARKPQRISQGSPGVPEPLFSATQAGSYSSCCLRSSSVTPYLSRGGLEAAEVIHFAAEPVAPRSHKLTHWACVLLLDEARNHAEAMGRAVGRCDIHRLIRAIAWLSS
jgi:hypothetical protein